MKSTLKLSLTLGCFISLQAMAMDKTICGTSDDRVPSQNPKVGRILEKNAPAGCTVTMIGKACAISAGHCTSTFEIAEFNTPASRGGQIQHPDQRDVYEVDKSSIVYKNNGRGDDFAVFRLQANKQTGNLAGVMQGNYMVSFVAPKKGDLLRITGYGADSGQGDRNFAQQSHTAEVYNISGSILEHRVDTMGGNSGSSVINEETNEIVAIHTHGGCYASGGANSSTLIAAHEAAKKAITDCLKWEEDNL